MHSRQQHGDFQPVANNGTFSQQHYSTPPAPSTLLRIEIDSGVDEEQDEPGLYTEITQDSEKSVMTQENIAYELLLLQQRLTAYEQLHTEEMAELRQEIERLRRAFLQETSRTTARSVPTRQP